MKGTSSPTSTASAPSSSPGGAKLPPFDFQPLNRVVFGAGTAARLGELAAGLGMKRVLLVSDPGLTTTGHPRRAEQSLRAAGLEVTYFDSVQPNPSSVDVERATDKARECAANGLVALGGGSAMDCAKGANFLLTNGGHMKDYQGFGKATKPMLPSVGVPTTAGTGSEGQSYALITDEKTHLKMACGDKKAAFRVCVLDPELTLSQPPLVTAVTGLDALAHAVESYVCLKRSPLSMMLSREAFVLLEANFETVLRSPHDLAARSAMLWGAHLAGMAIENSMLGICHSCANPLTAHYGITHGTAIGLLLPAVIRFNAQTAAEAYLGLDDTDRLASRVEEFRHQARLPTRLRDLEVSQTILPLLAEEAASQWTARFNPRPVDDKALLEVYRQAW